MTLLKALVLNAGLTSRLAGADYLNVGAGIESDSGSDLKIGALSGSIGLGVTSKNLTVFSDSLWLDHAGLDMVGAAALTLGGTLATSVDIGRASTGAVRVLSDAFLVSSGVIDSEGVNEVQIATGVTSGALIMGRTGANAEINSDTLVLGAGSLDAAGVAFNIGTTTALGMTLGRATQDLTVASDHLVVTNGLIDAAGPTDLALGTGAGSADTRLGRTGQTTYLDADLVSFTSGNIDTAGNDITIGSNLAATQMFVKVPSTFDANVVVNATKTVYANDIAANDGATTVNLYAINDGTALNLATAGSFADITIGSAVGLSVVHVPYQLDAGNVDRVLTTDTIAVGGTNADFVYLGRETHLTKVMGDFEVAGTATFDSTIFYATADTNAAAVMTIGATNATNLELSRAGQTTYVKGAMDVAEGATFHSTVQYDTADTLTATQMYLGTTNATELHLANAGATTYVEGPLSFAAADYAGAVTIGATNATSLDIGRSGVTTTINGALSFAATDTAAALDIGTATATTITIGRTGQLVHFPGNVTIDGTLTASISGASASLTVTPFTNGATSVTQYQMGRISANNTVMPTDASLMTKSRFMGVRTTSNNMQIAGIAEVQLDESLTVSAGQIVYLSPASAGLGTNVVPTTAGQVVAPVGIITDASTYAGTGRVKMLIQVLSPVQLP